MPRNMSFALTTEQFKNRTKTVTRRKGWKFLKPGDLVMGVEKGMGLKKGEKVKQLGLIKIKSVRRQQLMVILCYPGDPELEGFPGMSVVDFARMYCKHNGGNNRQIVTRIEFEYV